MGIFIDVAIIAIFILNIIIGYKKGLVNVIFNVFAFLIAIITTLILYKPVANFVIENTEIDDKIREIIINNNYEENVNNEQNQNEEENKTVIEKYIQNKIKEGKEQAKEQVLEIVADTISFKIVQILVGIALFISIRVVVIILKFFTESLSELPIIKQFNQTGGVLYGVLKSLVIIYLILTIMFFVISVRSDGIISEAVNSSYITKFLYDNNIILKTIAI